MGYFDVLMHLWLCGLLKQIKSSKKNAFMSFFQGFANTATQQQRRKFAQTWNTGADAQPQTI